MLLQNNGLINKILLKFFLFLLTHQEVNNYTIILIDLTSFLETNNICLHLINIQKNEKNAMQIFIIQMR